MNITEKISVGDYVTFEDPNFNKQEICQVFLIQNDENGNIFSVSIERKGKYIESGEIKKYPRIGSEDPYIWSTNPVIIDLVNPIHLDSILPSILQTLRQEGYKLESNDIDSYYLVKSNTKEVIAEDLKHLHELQEVFRQTLKCSLLDGEEVLNN